MNLPPAHHQEEATTRTIRVSKVIDERLALLFSNLLADDVLEVPPPLDTYGCCCDTSSKGKTCHEDASETSLQCWGEDSIRSFQTKPTLICSSTLLELEDLPTACWTIQVLEGDISDSPCFRIYFEREGEYVYYRGDEIIRFVEDLIEFTGRAMFHLDFMSKKRVETLGADSVLGRLKQLILQTPSL